MLEKIFDNKWVLWIDAVVTVGLLLYTAYDTTTAGFYPWYVPVLCLAIAPIILVVVFSLKGLVTGWE